MTQYMLFQVKITLNIIEKGLQLVSASAFVSNLINMVPQRILNPHSLGTILLFFTKASG